MPLSRLVAIAATAILVAPVFAHSFTAGSIRIGHPWSRETAPSQSVGAGYMTLTNTGKSADRLISASSPAARSVEIHTMSMTGGVMRMRKLDAGLAIPAGKTVSLAPGGYHIMLIGLAAPLKRGAVVPATLRFAKGGSVKIGFKVEPVNATNPGAKDHGKH